MWDLDSGPGPGSGAAVIRLILHPNQLFLTPSPPSRPDRGSTFAAAASALNERARSAAGSKGSPPSRPHLHLHRPGSRRGNAFAAVQHKNLIVTKAQRLKSLNADESSVSLKRRRAAETFVADQQREDANLRIRAVNV